MKPDIHWTRVEIKKFGTNWEDVPGNSRAHYDATMAL
ncbi:hypothetical protein Vi05172_g7591 [Venturia inaequalis]|nr:hypothetical protein Vi05172_g7591 [Venturia inaequalis]